MGQQVIEVDSLCEKYEESWAPEKSGRERLQEFIAREKLPESLPAELLVELVKIDLELSWQRWHKWLRQSREISNLLDVVSRFNALPRLDQYLEAFFPKPLEVSRLSELVSWEATCRTIWGDMPNLDGYTSKYGMSASLRIVPTKWLVFLETGQIGSTLLQPFPLNGLTMFGRRRTSDPLNQNFFREPERNRIVIGELNESTISREQLSVQILSCEIVMITNHSGLIPVWIQGSRELAPQSLHLMAMPTVLSLPGRQLQFRKYCD